MSGKLSKSTSHRVETNIVHLGRNPSENAGVVNPPVYHASTILFDSYAEMKERQKNEMTPENIVYGRKGTPTSFAFEKAVAQLEGGDHAFAVSSGLGALTTAILAFVSKGGQILIPDSVYPALRFFCNEMLVPLGIEVGYYDPRIGADISTRLQDNTQIVMVESPGSVTFEIQDLPAISAQAHKKGAVVILDNTWASPLFNKPFGLGVDISIHAATKYIVGHSDVMLGVIVTKKEHYNRLKNCVYHLGQCAGPDDLYLGQRGLRTLAVRMKQHEASAIAVAKWLESRPEVSHVYHPALESHPDHALWKRDFTGSSGLFSFLLEEGITEEQIAAMVDHMELFGLGHSWGGYESLILPKHLNSIRSVTDFDSDKTFIRLHIGLENVDDLILDLDKAFGRLKNA